ncbi:ERF family protein [Pseudanabaena phage Pam4]|nr:ERF family protein [Pseudanabaena phage Pam4]
MPTKPETAEPAATIHTVLLAVQREMPIVARGNVADTGKYEYRYADLADVQGAVLPLLNSRGVTFVCAPRRTEGGYELAGTLHHAESGTSVEGALPLRGNDMQAVGSSITYARRYLLGCLTGIVTDNDPDAHHARGTSATRTWDGPGTPALLNRLDAAASRAGVTYDVATAKFRERGGYTLDDLDRLEPWLLLPLVEAVEKRAEEVVAEQARAAAEQAAAAAGGTTDNTAGHTGEQALPDPADGNDPWATPAPTSGQS